MSHLSQHLNDDTLLVELNRFSYGGVWVPNEELTDGSRCTTCGILLNSDTQSTNNPSKCYLCDRL